MRQGRRQAARLLEILLRFLSLTGIEGWSPFLVNAAISALATLPLFGVGDASHGFGLTFAEKPLEEQTVYQQVTQKLPEYFATRPLIPLPGGKPMNLVELLRAPATTSPKSLREQLDFRSA